MRVAHVITRLIVGGAQENTVATVFGLHRKADVTVRLYSGPTTGPEGSLESGVRDIEGLLHLIPSLIRPVHPLQDFLAYCHLVREFKNFRPDIVHTHSGKASSDNRPGPLPTGQSGSKRSWRASSARAATDNQPWSTLVHLTSAQS